MPVGEIITGLDIGTSKVCAVIGQITGQGEVKVLASAKTACSGVKKGIIVDIDAVSSAVRSAVSQAEQKANTRVTSAYVSISGMHVQLIKSNGSVSIHNEAHEITRKDVENAVNNAYMIDLPSDRQVVDILPRQFIVDGYDGIVDPVGMAGSRLEVEVDLVAGTLTSVQSIIRSIEKVGIKVSGIITEAMAAAAAVLTQDEMEMGVALVDIGAGITDISVFSGNKLVYYKAIPVGGDHFTNDIAYGLKIPYVEADRLKKNYGIATVSLIKHDQAISIASINDVKNNTINISEVVEIIEARVNEMFELINRIITDSGFHSKLNAGMMVTGCGMTTINGSIQMATDITGLPAKSDSGRFPASISQEFVVAYGVISHVAKSKKDLTPSRETLQKAPTARLERKKKSGFLQKLKEFFKNI